MEIHEIEIALKELEQKFKGFDDNIKPLTDKLAEIDSEMQETDNKFAAELERLREERRKKLDEFYEIRSETQKQVWAAQSEASALQAAMRKLQQQHAAALKEIAAKERMAKIYEDIKGWLEDSPWSAHIKEFQKEDVLAIITAYKEGKAGILNANVMGAGKTFETGAVYDILSQMFYEEHGRLPLVLWLTRKALMKSTAAELLQWNPDRRFVPVEGDKTMRENMLNIAVQANIPVISNYELLNSTQKARDIEWDFVIMDECHKLKGGEGVKLFHHTVEVTQKSRFFLGLSGSPIQNKPEDIWPVFHILDNQRFPTVRRFQREFTRDRWDENKKQFVAGVDEARLLEVMVGQVIKQDPKLIQASWPDKRRIFKVVEMNGCQREVYDKCKRGIISHFEKEAETNPDKVHTITAIIAQLTYLRQINVWPAGVTVKSPDGDETWHVNCQDSAKMDEAEALIEELVGEGEQIVVWSAQFNEPLFELARRLEENYPEISYALMTGQTPDADRQGNEIKFQNGELNVLLLNRTAFSEGFNFQKNPGRWDGGASKAVFLDAWWNPKANEQAEDRIWRTGQNENVDIYYIYTEDSVDAFIAAKLDEKEAMIKGIMDSDVLRPSDVVGILQDLL